MDNKRTFVEWLVILKQPMVIDYQRTNNALLTQLPTHTNMTLYFYKGDQEFAIKISKEKFGCLN